MIFSAVNLKTFVMTCKTRAIIYRLDTIVSISLEISGNRNRPDTYKE